jgi:hypothetical protein
VTDRLIRITTALAVATLATVAVQPTAVLHSESACAACDRRHCTPAVADFMPVTRRTLKRSGFVIDHVQYYCDALKPCNP